jgi:hypothetical protein
MYRYLEKELFSVLVMILLTVLVVTDKKMLWKGKIIFLSLILIQILLYEYCGVLYIDLIKDIFWFSLILNVGVIWHNLILNRLLIT